MNKPISMRDRILNAAAAILVEYGTQASMSKIAARAGVSAGSLYNYFESKDVLLRAVYENLAEAMIHALTANADPQAPAPQRLEHYIDSYISFIWSDPNRAILFEYLSNVPLLPPEDMIQAFSASSEHIGNILIDLDQQGWLMQGDLALMGGYIGGAIRNTLKWHRAFGKPLTHADHEQIKAMCIRSVQHTAQDAFDRG